MTPIFDHHRRSGSHRPRAGTVSCVIAALVGLIAAPTVPATAADFCLGMNRPDAATATRSGGPWRVRCHQAGVRVFEAEGLYAVCRWADGRWEFDGWFQQEGGAGWLIERSPDLACFWRRDKDGG